MIDDLVDQFDQASKQDKEDIKSQIHEELMKDRTAVDIDNLTPQKHIWVDRGLVMSCEYAGHASHRSFKRAK